MDRKISTFAELEDYFLARASDGIRPGLERIGRLMEKLGNPEGDYPAIHIVGTNGKGSTAAFCASILAEGGYSVAQYTSPHLESPAERLLINGAPLSLEEWTRAAEAVALALDQDEFLRGDPPTFFELVTATAFLLCSWKKVEVAVMEAGLGGRLDGTNLLGKVVLTLITSISMDHMDFLGDDLGKIAGEKFAVMRKGVPAFFAGSPPELIPQFKEKALASGALPHVLSEEVEAINPSVTAKGTSFTFQMGDKTLSLHTALRGVFQVQNCSLAVAAMICIAERFTSIDDEAIVEGALKARWPGRFEILRDSPPLVLDGGHNPEGVKRLVESLELIYGDLKPTVVFASMKDKNFAESLSSLKKSAGVLLCTSVPGNARAADPMDLLKRALEVGWEEGAVMAIPDPGEALKESERIGKGTICCGSLYFIGFMRTLIFSRRGELGF